MRDRAVVYADGQSSYSPRCQDARAGGRLPLGQAATRVRQLCKAAGKKVTLLAARVALRDTHDGEWHHTSRYANRTDYYDVAAAVAWATRTPATKRLEEMRAAMRAATLQRPKQRPHARSTYDYVAVAMQRAGAHPDLLYAIRVRMRSGERDIRAAMARHAEQVYDNARSENISRIVQRFDNGWNATMQVMSGGRTHNYRLHDFPELFEAARLLAAWKNKRTAEQM